LQVAQVAVVDQADHLALAAAAALAVIEQQQDSL
jgi:hypothetical protein